MFWSTMDGKLHGLDVYSAWSIVEFGILYSAWSVTAVGIQWIVCSVVDEWPGPLGSLLTMASKLNKVPTCAQNSVDLAMRTNCDKQWTSSSSCQELVYTLPLNVSPKSQESYCSRAATASYIHLTAAMGRQCVLPHLTGAAEHWLQQ